MCNGHRQRRSDVVCKYRILIMSASPLISEMTKSTAVQFTREMGRKEKESDERQEVRARGAGEREREVILRERETDRQTDRQTDYFERERETDRERERVRE